MKMQYCQSGKFINNVSDNRVLWSGGYIVKNMLINQGLSILTNFQTTYLPIIYLSNYSKVINELGEKRASFYVYLSISPSIYLYLSIYLRWWMSWVHLTIPWRWQASMYIYLSISLNIYLSLHLYIYLSI